MSDTLQVGNAVVSPPPESRGFAPTTAVYGGVLTLVAAGGVMWGHAADPTATAHDLKMLRPAADHRVVDAEEDQIPRIAGDQAWFWTPEWQAKEREADEDIVAGRVHEFDSTDAFLAELDS